MSKDKPTEPVSSQDSVLLTASTITDVQIREAYCDGLIGYDLLEFATFPAWQATQRYYRARCAEILNAAPGTKLAAASRLVKEAACDVAVTDFERWELLEVAKELDALVARFTIAIEEIPSEESPSERSHTRDDQR